MPELLTKTTKISKTLSLPFNIDTDKRNKKNPIKLWIIVLFMIAAGLTGSVFGIYRYQNQGKMWLTFEDSSEEGVSYVLTLHRIKGFGVQHTPISKEYANGGNMFAIIKRATPQESIEDLFGGEPYAVAVTGKGWGGFLVKYILKETGRGLSLVPIVGEYGGDPDEAFLADDVSFADIDNDGIIEVDEINYLAYQGAPDQIWHTWHRYNQSAGRYEFFRKDKEIATEWDIE